MQSENILGYYIDVERIPNNCKDSRNRIILKDRNVLLNLSMAYYRVNISAYNNEGESPQTIYIVPDSSATGTNFNIYSRKWWRIYMILI